MSTNAPTASLALERLRRLPQRDDVFEVALVRMPMWITGESAAPYRPMLSVAMSRRADIAVDGQMLLPEEVADHRPIEAISKLAVHERIGYRPTAVVVRDAALLAGLRDELATLDIDVQFEPALAALDHFVSEMRRWQSKGMTDPGLLDGAGVTLAEVRSYADAVVEFSRATPWCSLADYDLVRVESDHPGRDWAHFVVMGGGGQEYGLAFFDSPADHAAFSDASGPRSAVYNKPRWSMTLEPIHRLSFPDADLWAEHDLPVHDAASDPSLHQMARGHVPRSPDATALAFVEGLLRALASTSEDDYDSGRWRKRVQTSAGEHEYVLALPGVLDPPPRAEGMPDRRLMDRTLADLHAFVAAEGLEGADQINARLKQLGGMIPARKAVTPRELAADKYFAALEAHGRLRTKLAREALALDGDYADALVLLAEDMPDPKRARDLWRHAFDVATRTLGAEAFSEHAGHFWGVLETRPYMRARGGLASLEWATGNKADAIEHWRGMLALDPRDHLGARLVLVPSLLELGRDDTASEVLAACMDDHTALLEFARLLLVFRRDGAGASAQAALAGAVRANRHVLKQLLTPPADRPTPSDHLFRPGEESEAAMVIIALKSSFHDTPGALAWLRSQRLEDKKARKKSAKKR